MVNLTAALTHPYHPAALSLPHYTAPQLTRTHILAVFFSAVFVVLGVAYQSIAATRRHTTPRRLLFLWFITCGFIHSVVEGYFAYNHKAIAGQDAFLAEMWKEYALSDSRYMSADPFVVVMESVTAYTWGPLSFLTAYTIYTNSPLSPLLEFLVSTGQLYGDVLYYLTTLIEGAPHCSQDPFHFWFYFVFLNAFWIVIPACVMFASGARMVRAVSRAETPAAGVQKKIM
ncbi:hypothetical protein HDU87_006119 [Geranomyces variabilis]|uniref:EXPERA domain-containing protein n=1 Tax=Geranomyces variabilis TaxID=109894 RepID=A0AAD5TLL7_9FUNG|nr:hypothetical protein HDU87_006119 [Geranomyces variabilis]